MTEEWSGGPRTAEEAAYWAAIRLSDSPPFWGYGPTAYPGQPTGPGRWVMLTSAGNDLGWLWTNDTDALGFFPTTHAGIQHQGDFQRAFVGAYEAGAVPQVVFDAYAEKDGLGLAALQVETGDLGAWWRDL